MTIQPIPLHDATTNSERRSVLKALAASTLLAFCNTGLSAKSAGQKHIERLREIEQMAKGRLGAYIFDTQTQSGFGWREQERFAHCSSFKMSLAAMVLSMSDQGAADLEEVLRWKHSDMLPVSPVTQENTEKGLTVEALARATLVTSDNTAANVLLKRFGGPSALTNFWGSLGDRVSQLDRYEPELNTTPPGTTLDTTTPKAMALTTAALVHGNHLKPSSKTKLKAWMADVRTGSERLRAGFPVDWASGDKTGTGIGKTKHTYVDIAYGGPAGRAPLIVAAYFEPAKLVEPLDSLSMKVLADVGRVATASGGWNGNAPQEP